MSANLTPEERAAISAELAAGRKIDAIKLYRRATGQGLKEAVDAIEHFNQRGNLSQSGSRSTPIISQSLTDEQVEDITLALANGNKIEAIKIYRTATGKDLKDSKDFIEALIPQLKQQDPERFARASEMGKVGCGVKLLLLGLGLGAWAIRLLA